MRSSSVTETWAGGGGGHQKAGEPLSAKKSPLRGWVLESMGLWFFIQEGEHRKKRDGQRRGSEKPTLPMELAALHSHFNVTLLNQPALYCEAKRIAPEIRYVQ